MNMKRIGILFFIAILHVHSAYTQVVLPFRDPTFSPSARAKDLLARMTAEEKFYQVFMVAHDGVFNPKDFPHGIFGMELNAAMINTQMMDYKPLLTRIGEMNKMQKYFVENTRLGIPALFFGEALHGAVAENCVSFPQSIALAASFDESILNEVFDAVAEESQSLGWRQVLSPVINIAGDARWGRVEETYGEDPYWTSVCAVQFVKAFEQRNIIATPKHFLANYGEGGRDSYPVYLSENALENIYYPPFKAAFKAGARSVMTSYNSLNGIPCSMNPHLLIEKLKTEWMFGGFVISDAGAVGGANVLHNTSTSYEESGKQAIENGLDVIFQTSIKHDELFKPPFLNNTINAAALDSAVFRVLKAKFELGLFENPYITEQNFNVQDHIQLARKSAEASAVLLKNKSKLLPLKQNGNWKFNRLAVIGHEAKACRLGGYSGAGIEPVSYYEACAKEFPQVNYASGVSIHPNAFNVVPDSVLSTWKYQWYATSDFLQSVKEESKEGEVNVHYTFAPPIPEVSKSTYSVVMHALLTAPATGDYEIGLEGNDGFQLYVNGALVVDQSEKVSYHRKTKSIHFEKGKVYAIEIRFFETYGNGQLKFIWNYGVKSEDTAIKEAIAVAKKSDCVLFFAGIEEGEFQDRNHIGLPGRQEELLLALTKLNKPMVVVLTGGSVIGMENWIDEVDAVLMMWYGGEQQGNALVNVLIGKVNPSGKLPITFARNEGQLPLTYYHASTGRGDDYVDGTGWPMFPFGYGMSYTTFDISLLTASGNSLKGDEEIELSTYVVNTGEVGGAEVVQLYVSETLGGESKPIQRLIGVEKVYLEPHEVKQVVFTVGKEELQTFETGKGWGVWSKSYEFSVGNSSKNLVHKVKVELIK